MSVYSHFFVFGGRAIAPKEGDEAGGDCLSSASEILLIPGHLHFPAFHELTHGYLLLKPLKVLESAERPVKLPKAAELAFARSELSQGR